MAHLQEYLCKLGMRIVSTIKFIADRGLAYRGTDELIDSIKWDLSSYNGIPIKI